MNYFGIYVLTKLDGWHRFTGSTGLLFIIASGVLLFVVGIISSNDYTNTFETFKKYAKALYVKTTFTIGVILIILGQLLPTTKQAAFIYIAPQIIENGAVKDTVKNIPELTKLGTDYLKELLKEKVENVK